jgi:hypothetical protein
MMSSRKCENNDIHCLATYNAAGFFGSDGTLRRTGPAPGVRFPSNAREQEIHQVCLSHAGLALTLPGVETA